MRFSLNLKSVLNHLLLFSLPSSNHYQQINNLKITPQNYQIITDKKWKNRILVFSHHLCENGNDYQTNLSFDVKNFSVKKTINSNFTTSLYNKNNILKIYLKSNRFINGKDEQIKKLTKKIIGKERNLYQIIKKLYDFTLDYLFYGKPINGLYTYKQALNEKITDCGGFSTFLASLLQSQNIPSRLVVGFIIKKNFLKNFLNTLHVLRLPRTEFILVWGFTLHNLLIHAWLEVLLPDNSWFPMDPSIEWKRKKGLSSRQGGFGFIPADRLVTSFGCDFDIKINGKNYKIDLLQKPVILLNNGKPRTNKNSIS